MSKVIEVVKGVAVKNPLLRPIAYKAKLVSQSNDYKKYYKKYEVDDKLCVFEAFNGRKYCDSPKAIYLEMLNDKKYKDYKFVWAFKDPEEFKYLEKNDRTKIVKYHSSEYKKTYASAKYWFTPSRLPDYIKPKKNQVYVQCWHGTPLKRLGFDIKVKGKNATKSVKEWKQIYEYDAKRYSYMLSPSKFCTEKFTSAFNLKEIGKEDCIIEVGYPRNDALFKYNQKYVSDLKKKLNIPKDKKIILYAPTWRDDQYKVGVGYTYKLGLDFDKFKKKFSKDYVILFRTHYLVASSVDLSKYKDFIIDVSNYDDINDLYILGDILITDYSSVFFDYANLKKPILYYMYDFDDYKNNMRDFYFDIDELPGPIIKTEEELYKEISNIDKYDEKYKEKYEKFNKKFNYLDDACASKRVLDIVIK